ncbi:ABC transporter substrate-binding protein [Rhodococcus globerulus]|uniref:ABC transporter substrate-binding protein n=1 Tax=Rhodococcus globerulus TaxID=33008 RepID=UPI001C597461|nr:ABC transporter substrate-binding protein [Rhodococcus globerulus]QXW01321.1 ABC transporter substrate-binding protein [Rhodococcus globerulus]
MKTRTQKLRAAGGAVAVLTSLFLATSCSNGVSSGEDGSGNVNLKVATYEGLWLEAPVYVAEERGIFADHGLEIERINIPTGPTQIAAAQSGSVDVVTLTTNAIMQSNAKGGLPFVQLIGNIQHQIYGVSGLESVMANCPYANKPYPEPIKCMKGKRLGVTALGSDNYNVALSLLQDAGMSKDDVDILPLGGGTQLPLAMQNGQADFAVNTEPGPTQVEKVWKIAVPVVPLQTGDTNKYFSTWSGSGFFATEPAVEKKPQAYQRFVDAMVEASDWAADPANEQELVAIFKKYAPNTADETIRELAKTAPETFGARMNCDGVMNAAEWLAATDQAVAEDLPTNCEDFVWSYTTEKYLVK